jgi:glycosyltransferase involved in cell wall biosynthesis
LTQEDEQQPPQPPSHRGEGAPRRSFHRRRRPHRPPTQGTTGETAAAPETQAAVKAAAAAAAPQPLRQHGQPRSLDLSVVIPLFNEEQSIEDLVRQLRDVLSTIRMSYEVIFVDDGSSDGSFNVLRRAHQQNPRIKVIRFRRNYGKSAALSVGFKSARGAIVITMDADLQDDPREIPNLIRRIREGYDLVSGWKKKRRDPITRTIPSKFFNFVTSLMSGLKLHDFNCGLKAYRSGVVKEVRVYGELHRYIPALAHFSGFRVTEVPVEHRPRKFGKSKFGAGRFLRGFLDLLTVLFTTRYFRRPLHFFGAVGSLFALAGLVINVWLSILKLLGETSISNRPLFLVGILLIVVGVQFVSIGLLGEMITKAQHSEEEYSIRETIM